MAEFISIPDGLVDNFRGHAKRDGVELPWKAMQPISVKVPNNRSVVPIEVLEDPDLMEAFPPLSAMPVIDESVIEFWQWDEETDTYF